MEKIEKINSKFWFKNEYEDTENRAQVATVVLEINYQKENYSIKPYCGSMNVGFKFEESSQDYKKWKAILKSIEQAIDFANEELFVNFEHQ